MSEQKQKFLSTVIVGIGALLGFLALSFIASIYQVKTYLWVSIYVYIFHIFWLTFLFDLHFKNKGVLANARLNHRGLRMFWEAFKDRSEHVFNWHYFSHYQNYLVLPGIIYWSAVMLIFLNPFKEFLKQLIVISATLSMTVAYWYFKEIFSRRMEAEEFGIKILSLVKIFAAFLIYSAILGMTWYFGLTPELLILSVFGATFFLLYQALFQHRLLDLVTYLLIIGIGLVIALVSNFVYMRWQINYLTGGLVMSVVYNSLWGMLHHYLDRNLTKKLVFEYVLMTILILSFIFASHDFTPRIN